MIMNRQSKLETYMKETGCLLKGNEGVTAVLVAIMIVMLLSFAALAIDIGYGKITKNELQNAADAAALAAARQLGLIYKGMSYEDQENYALTATDEALIKGAAINVASKNRAGGVDITVNSEDIVIGDWEPSSSPPVNPAASAPPHAVRVRARRDALANGPISTFFAKVFGVSSMDVSAVATAALTGPNSAPKGGLPIPVGISCAWVNSHTCGDVITFYPTTSSCAGWNTYTSSPSNSDKLRCIMDGGKPNCATDPNLANCATLGLTSPGCFQSPETTAGQTQFSFTGGTVGAAFPDMTALFDVMKKLDDGILDMDKDLTTWTTSVPVFADPDGSCVCNEGGSNPSGEKLIVGFATITMSEVLGPGGGMELRGKLICDIVKPGDSGGMPTGTLGDIPGLVE